MSFSRFRCVVFVSVSVSMALLTGCATIQDPRDPLEPVNRELFEFNKDFDDAIGKPIAEAYQKGVPRVMRTGVSNFFSNLGDVVVILNDILQLKFEQAMKDTMRFTANTVFGALGLIDVATPMGLPKNNEDFGQTMATWGVGNGPYMVLPFLGPSTVRDAAGLYVDFQVAPILQIEEDALRYAVVGLRLVDIRAQALGVTRILDEAALDQYAFMRDAYLQLRLNQVYDGNPPREKFSQQPSQEDLELERELELELDLQSESVQ
ncbi:MAG: VacJ family lipoprotein [Pseudomonadota bacterium]|nr:MAG: VacJ family lipoprotein [Pseudomonadota bacterium]